MLSWNGKRLPVIALLSKADTCLLLRSQRQSAVLLSDVEVTKPPAGCLIRLYASKDGSASASLVGWSGAATDSAVGCRARGREAVWQGPELICICDAGE